MKNIYISLYACLLLCMSQAAFAQVPQLSSYKDSIATIYLDFDGQTVVGTSWNGDGPLDCASAYLNKPDDLFEIVQTVNSILSQKAARPPRANGAE